VTLTDFGRAIDLEDLDSSTPLDCKLKGRACRDDMMCVAMRNGLPWSFDVDTYGLCDTAHILLFGCGMEITRNTATGRFAPKQKFRRYHQIELWSLLFDTLLNLEEPSKTAIGSRPGSLRQVRNKFDTYLRAKEMDVKLLLNQQAGFLPSTRSPRVSPSAHRRKS
jgi:checkpoint serine/threonine-protein kinase